MVFLVAFHLNNLECTVETEHERYIEGLTKRDSTIEKESPLKGFHYRLKVRPLYHDWLIYLNYENYLSCIENKGGYERHFVYFLIQRGNFFSTIKSLLSD